MLEVLLTLSIYERNEVVSKASFGQLGGEEPKPSKVVDPTKPV